MSAFQKLIQRNPLARRLLTQLLRRPGFFAAVANARDRFLPRYGEPELALVPLLADPGEMVFDVGANNGIYTYRMLKTGQRVFAFEPNPACREVLRRRFAGQIRAKQLVIVDAAISDRRHTAKLFVPTAGSAWGSLEHQAAVAPGVAIEAECVPLDFYQGDGKVSLIKIDVEGHEQEAVAGGLELIARDRPTLLIEAEERHRAGAVAGLRQLLEPLGYSGFFSRGGELRPIEEFDAAKHQRVVVHELPEGAVTEADYVYNFLFVARSAALARLNDAGLMPRPSRGL